MLLTIFHEIPDHRRAQGRMYDLPHLLFFTVLAVLSGADSYRSVHSFIKAHFNVLGDNFNIAWRKTPAYTTIRHTIQAIDAKEIEKAFRKYAKSLARFKTNELNIISLDGKTLRGSFDNFNDQKAIQVFSAMFKNQQIILAHEKVINEKTNEIPIAQKLIKDLNLQGCLFTADAMHCQKKR